LNWYKVLVNGENFFIDVDGVSSRRGFFVTRDVQATNEDSARDCAVNLVAGELMVRFGKKVMEGTELSLMADEIDEIDPSMIDNPLQGYIFFPMS
jgi:hypothetical protein